jgi:hypothetical protein
VAVPPIASLSPRGLRNGSKDKGGDGKGTVNRMIFSPKITTNYPKSKKGKDFESRKNEHIK